MSVKKLITLCASVIILSGFITIGVVDALKTKDNLEFQKLELKTKQTEMQQLNDKYKTLNNQLEEAEQQHDQNQSEIEKLEQERLRLEQEKKDLESKLQAKLEHESKVASATTLRATSPVSGDKYTWMVQAGIPESDHTYVNFIVQKESSWNPNAVNRSSGACGLAQALPCSKIGDNWNNPVVALKWQHNYVTKRYGGYQQAYNFWISNGWY